jgi:ABC-type sugar transport system permease subunit
LIQGGKLLMKIRLREPAMAVLFIIPAFIFVALFLYYPLLQTVLYSFFKLHRTVDWLNQPFMGLQNYVAVIKSEAFRGSFTFTLYFTTVTVVFELAIGLGMAIATFSVHDRLRGILRAVLVVPWAIPPIVSAMLWKWLFHADAGVFAYVLGATGLVQDPPPFLTNPTLAVHSIILASVWKNASIMGILLLGGLASIPQDIYDAAKVDGARAWFRFRRVTFPMLLPTVLVTVLFRSLWALRMFELSYGLTGGGPGTTTDTLSTFAYKFFFTYARFGVGSAYAIVIFAIVLAVAIIYVSRVKENLRFKE